MAEILNPETYMLEFFGENYTEEQKKLAADIIRSVPAMFTYLCIQHDENGNPGFYPVCNSNDILRYADSICPIPQQKEIIGECDGHH